MAEVHHFTYGAFNPIAAYLVAVLGSFLGLLATGRARGARSRGRRNRWLIIAAFSIGGAGIWLMHFTAMLGFDVPQSPVRYTPWLMMASLGLSVVTVGIGLMVVGHGRRSLPKIALAGLFTGAGVLAMHYTGMAGLHVSGTIHFNRALVAASAVIAVVACTAALWFAVSVKGWFPMAGAAALMGAAVAGMHYTGMASMSVELSPDVSTTVSGIKPLLMIVPITLVSAALILGVALSALQAMTDEEFTEGDGVPRRGMHAENPWSLRQASLAAPVLRRSPAGRPSSVPRPSPRPVPPRPKPLVEEPLLDVPS
ncbi:MHYT domain-containing protein [Amorphoplanes nipponensis]|uniref:Membrane protein n=1 Tax=Actinoplanes nipponensis TaxID=135950 RepID=A0A919JKQ3_9ACTN|nr:MHYT domain-containing protein [Actinoplanes nipponensis]GIE52588.1 membrane protein [Actinoplanes nipponensis]